MEADEAAVVSHQSMYRRTLFQLNIADAGWWVVNSTSDGVLVEFSGVREAVGCALNLQTQLAEMEADHQEEKKIKYRIVIHVGDVVDDDCDLFGDTVNLAARLEALCASGGLGISDSAMQMLDSALQRRFADLGTAGREHPSSRARLAMDARRARRIHRSR